MDSTLGILIAFCALSVSLVLTPLFRDFFCILGFVDRPDSQRKTHIRPIPRVGGMALAISYAGALLVIGLLNRAAIAHDPSIRLMLRLAPAALIVFATGLLDDLSGLSPLAKLAGQTVAAAYACWAGAHLGTPPGYTGSPIWLNLLSIFWLVLCANALNLIDGLDGLAAGVGLFASTSLLLAAVIHHHPGLALAITPLIGGLFGFLYYNFNPASVFLGDCGSLLVGFLLGCYGLLWHQHATTGLGMAAPLVAVAFPLFEVVLSVFRRFLRTRPIFSADGNHIHHRIQKLGLSQRSAVLVLYGVSAVTALLAVLQTILQPRLITALFLLVLTVACIGLRSLKYIEFAALEQVLVRRGVSWRFAEPDLPPGI
jgi:UDP-GlcNAc:undecaprenyl-phosphate GlcNAc-1-phosphate transferase